ncbi:hypothetical protein [Methylobacterium brachiatum]|uniref:hypothetical protein n=1 Tax=Methylobacterium brachiatum TaxID=269660 RepID=UPI000EFB83BB|nr:hypothetical protein [Methylobacterium brachiatum]AYO83656.1 hypothetical protein EBB05_16205 [Methylobacterium brachiatum]
MAEPLVISFAADTSRAQSAMASLASQIVGNMTSIGVAMSGGAANANTFSGSLSGLASNIQRAASAVGQDVRNISTATATAATADKATLEGVVRAFTGAAAASTTAGTAVRSSLTATTSTITGVAAQIPSLNTLLAVFLGFEAAKLVFDSVAASIEAARKHIQEYVQIGKDAEKVGVGTDFFQRATLGADKFGLKVEQVVAALQHARDASEIKIGEGKDGTNTSAIDGRLTQNVKAGNLSAGDKAAFDNANGQEAKIRVMLDLIEKLRVSSRDVAAFDLAGKFFGPDFERQLRSGVDLTDQLRDTLNSTSTTVAGVRIVGADEVERANQLDAKAKDIADTFANALAPIQRDISNAVLDTYSAFLSVEAVIARVVQIAVNLYSTISGVVGQVRDLVGSIPGIGKIITAGNPLTFLQELGRATGAIDPEVQGPPAPLAVKVRPKGPDRSAVLPSLHTPKGRGGREESESLDAIETLINQLEKARDTAKAELDNVGKTNVEREKAIALAKAEAAAREEVKKGNRTDPALDDDERARVLAAAEAMQKYKDATDDAQQALRQSAEAAKFFAQSASDGLADAIINGKSFGSVLTDITKQLERSVLTGLLTGTGPLAGLLGTAPAASLGSNATGGLLGNLFGGLTKSGGGSAGSPLPGAQGPSLPSGGVLDIFGSLFRANGGPVSAGQPVTVGEMGRELFVPNADGKVMPIMGAAAGAGSQSIDQSRSYNIDARGAQMGVADQITARLAAYDQGLNRSLAARTAVANRRYSTGR